MSEDLLNLLDQVIKLALEEGVGLSQVNQAVLDRYIDLDIENSGESE